MFVHPCFPNLLKKLIQDMFTQKNSLANWARTLIFIPGPNSGELFRSDAGREMKSQDMTVRLVCLDVLKKYVGLSQTFLMPEMPVWSASQLTRACKFPSEIRVGGTAGGSVFYDTWEGGGEE